MKCSRCGSNARIKNGVLQGVQRYKCKIITVAFRRRTKPADQKRLVLLMYLEGLGFRSIGRILNVHNTTVCHVFGLLLVETIDNSLISWSVTK